MQKLALLGLLGVLLSACSCNGQRHVNGPDGSCDSQAISDERRALWQDIVRELEEFQLGDCVAAAPVVHAWLDAHGDALTRNSERVAACEVDVPPQDDALFIQVYRAGGGGCEEGTPGHEAFARLRTAMGGETVRINDE